MSNEKLYEVFKIIVGNLSLVLFLIAAAWKIGSKIKVHLALFEEIEEQLKCLSSQMKLLEKQFEEHGQRSERIFDSLLKRTSD